MSRRLNLGYTCHDAFPATTTNTHQIYWTLFETATQGATVELNVPALALSPPAASPDEVRRRLAQHYGAPVEDVPRGFSVVARGDDVRRTAFAKGRYDITAAPYLSRRGYDLIWTRDLVAAAGCVRAGLPVVFETYRHDLASARRFAWWRRLVLGRAAVRRQPRRGERSTIHGLIVHSQLTADAFVAAGVDPERCLVAYNGMRPRAIGRGLTSSQARRQLGLPDDRPLVVYTGTVGIQKGTDVLLELAAQLPEIRMLLVGVEPGSAEARRLADRTRALGAANVLVRPRLPAAEIAAYLQAADCLIIPPTAAPLRRFRSTVLPIKVFSYLGAGRPIVAPRLPDIEEILEDGVTARLVPPDDLPGAAAAIRALMADPERRRELGARAEEKSAAFTWQARAARILEFLARVTP